MDEINELIMFSSIQNEQGSKNALDIAVSHIGKANQFNQNKAHKFLTAIQEHLISKQGSPRSKFYTLFILKLIGENTQHKQILSILSSHNILKYLTQQAKQIDPKKPINDKGKSLFPDKSLGNDYIRLILQTLKFWKERYPKNKDNKPTKFRLAYGQLQEMNIVLPSEYKFYALKPKDPQRSSAIASQQRFPKTSASNIGQTPKGNNNYDKKILHSIQTIKLYQQDIGQQGAEQQCHKYHTMFKKQNQNCIKMIEQIAAQPQNTTNQKLLEAIFSLQQFYAEQNSIYEEHLSNNKDYYSYVQMMGIKCDQLLLKLGQHQKGQKKPSLKPERSEQNSGLNNLRTNNHIDKSSYNNNKKLASEFMQKLNQRSSKSPRVGFKAIKQQLSNDKNIRRSKRSTSGFKKSSVSKFGKSMSKSRIAEIFSNPPNPNPRQKRYGGQLIQKNRELESLMTSISKHQGIRRFITCNFKTKNPLFQNTHLQIGLKSQPIYEQINEFKVMIGLELYIGNKTQHMIKNMAIDYKGNQQVLLYGNPKTIDSILQSGIQNKHQLIVVPLGQQFPLIKMFLKYTINGQTIYQTIILPNSMLKLAHYRTLQKRQFVQFWNNSKIVRTSQFKLTRYITPDSLNKYITSLDQLTTYHQFIVKGSQSDYQLGCLVVLKQQYEGVLRISIRPNINAVIQVGIVDSNQQAYQSFIFYAQTLQTVLTHVDHNS